MENQDPKRPDEPKVPVKEPPEKTERAPKDLPPKVDNPKTPRIVDDGPV